MVIFWCCMGEEGNMQGYPTIPPLSNCNSSFAQINSKIKLSKVQKSEFRI